MADYSKCAYDMGLSPRDFLEAHNSMFVSGANVLRPYTWRVDGFTNRHAQIVLINNSVAAYFPNANARQGVLHTATIPHPSGAFRRIVEPSMIVPATGRTAGSVTAREVEGFLNTTIVRRKGYDRPSLDDDG